MSIEQLSGLAGKVEAAIERGLDVSYDVLRRDFDRQVERTYGNPIPTNKNGKAKWEHSGDLARGIGVQSSKGEREIVVTGPAAEPIKGYDGGYAEKLTKLNSSRRNDFPADAARIAEPKLQRVFEQEVKNALNL